LRGNRSLNDSFLTTSVNLFPANRTHANCGSSILLRISVTINAGKQRKFLLHHRVVSSVCYDTRRERKKERERKEERNEKKKNEYIFGNFQLAGFTSTKPKIAAR